MSKRLHCGGVRDLQGLLDRCHVNEETNCWEWRLACICPNGTLTPVVHIEGGVVAGRPQSGTMSASRAAWLLSGRRLPNGWVVWRAHCLNGRCINPQHCEAATRTDMRHGCALRGGERGPHRVAVALLQAKRTAVSQDRVRAIELDLAAGMTQRAAAAAHDVCKDTVRKIAAGRHPHALAAMAVVPMASVFTWRPAGHAQSNPA